MPAKKSAAKTDAVATSPVQTNDSLQNLYTGMGTTRDKRQFTTVQRSAKQNVAELDTEFTENDLAHNIVAIPAEDMTREWIDLQGLGEVPSQLETRLDEVGARTAMHEALLWSRLHGSALVVVGLSNQRVKIDPNTGLATKEPDLSLPAQRGAVEWLAVYDRWEVGTVTVDDSGDVETYNVIVDEKPVVIHASRVLRFDADPMPRRMREQANWGLSVLDRCREPMRDLNTAMASVAGATQEFSQTVLKMKGLTEMLAMDKGGVAQKRIALLNLMRSTFGIMTLDADDEYAEVQRAFSGVPEVLDRLIERVASAARMPVALLMGRSPAGLNATGDADLRWWYAHIAALQQVKLRPALWRLIELIAEGDGLDLVESKLALHFCALWKPTEKESADTHLVQAQADKINVELGALDPEEVRLARFAPTGYSVETVVEMDPEVDTDEPDVDPSKLDPEGNALPTSVDPQKTAMNGAQIQALQSIIIAVATGQLPRDSAVSMLVVAFQLSEADADKVIGSAGQGFRPTGGAVP